MVISKNQIKATHLGLNTSDMSKAKIRDIQACMEGNVSKSI